MASKHDEYPLRADLRTMMAENPLPTIAPETYASDPMSGDGAAKEARHVLSCLNAALAKNDAQALETCFFPDQDYWKDQLALTYHLRTFTTPGVISMALLETKALRKVAGEIELDGGAQFIPIMPTLQFIDCGIVFRTQSPGATCRGKLMLLPVQSNKTVEWKIWILTTQLVGFDVHPENEKLLRSPGRRLDAGKFHTDVLIIGGGNAAVALSARLKALGVDSVMAEWNTKPGDSWGRHYDSMRLHTPTRYCHLPYMEYEKHLCSPHLLKRNELSAHQCRYIETFGLNMITSAQIQSTSYDKTTSEWEVKLNTPAGQLTATSKQLVLATGIPFGSGQPNIPSIEDKHLYRGISTHSAHYQNAHELAKRGAQSVMVIGSGSTAFDVMEDCHAAGLKTTMNVRSSAHIIPLEYVCDKRALGAYDMGVEAADNLFMTVPICVDSLLTQGTMQMLASQEPHRYDALAATGFPVVDCRHPDALLPSNLLERAGGHYVDVGGTKPIEEGKVGVKARVEPVAYTETGLRFSDGSVADADAVIWCTGFADSNVRKTAARILSGGSANDEVDVGSTANSKSLGPGEIESLVDATWGIDSEGELRGMWKRHSRLDNFWVMGGHTQQHRWYSRTLALQIKAALEGILPPAYRHTPSPPARMGSLL